VIVCGGVWVGGGGSIQAVLCQEIQIAYRILISGNHTARDKTNLSACGFESLMGTSRIASRNDAQVGKPKFPKCDLNFLSLTEYSQMSNRNLPLTTIISIRDIKLHLVLMFTDDKPNRLLQTHCAIRGS